MKVTHLIRTAAFMLLTSNSPLLAQSEQMADVTVETALLRSAPSPNATVVKRLGQGTEVVVMERRGGWARVNSSGTIGYLRESLIAFQTNITPVPISDVSAQRTSLPLRTPAKTDLAIADSSGAAAARKENVFGIYWFTVPLSMSLPGSGFLFLLFKNRSGVTPSYTQQLEFMGKPPDYAKRWTESYTDALFARQKSAVIRGSLIGTAAGIIIWKFLP